MICPTCMGEGAIDGYCGYCSGSGEGQADGTSCPICKGSGSELFECEDCLGTGEEDAG